MREEIASLKFHLNTLQAFVSQSAEVRRLVRDELSSSAPGKWRVGDTLHVRIPPPLMYNGQFARPIETLVPVVITEKHLEDRAGAAPCRSPLPRKGLSVI